MTTGPGRTCTIWPRTPKSSSTVSSIRAFFSRASSLIVSAFAGLRLCQKLERGQYRLLLGFEVKRRLSLLFGALSLCERPRFRGDETNEPAAALLTGGRRCLRLIKRGSRRLGNGVTTAE